MFMNNFVKIILLDLIHMIFLEAVRNHVFKKNCRNFGSFRFEIHFFLGGGYDTLEALKVQELQQMGFSREITQEHAEKITCKRL